MNERHCMSQSTKPVKFYLHLARFLLSYEDFRNYSIRFRHESRISHFLKNNKCLTNNRLIHFQIEICTIYHRRMSFVSDVFLNFYMIFCKVGDMPGY